MNAVSLNSMMLYHPLARQMRQLKADLVGDKFADLLTSVTMQSDWRLSLYRFVAEKPLRYVDDNVIGDTLKIIRADPLGTLYTLEQNEADVSRAMFSLLRPGSSWLKDIADRISIESPSDIGDFDSIWHPEYVRYCEQIYNHLMKVPLDVIGKQKGKNYLEPTLPNRAKLLSDLGWPDLVKGYDPIIRNAISHGRIT